MPDRTWTYENDPGTTTAAQRRDAVRYTTGDTDAGRRLLGDQEIAFSLAQNSDDILLASVEATEAIIALLSKRPDTVVGPDSVSASQQAEAYREFLKILKKRVRRNAEWFVGGLTIAGKEVLADDADAIQPQFSIGMDDHEGTSLNDTSRQE